LGVVSDLAEVPALAVEVDALAVDAVTPERQPVEGAAQLHHHGLRLVTHEVEPEPVDLVLLGPRQHGIDQELAHHQVLRRGVGAARGGLDGAGGRIEPLVVAGDDAVEDRLRILAGGRRVVVDHVHDHPQARAVDPLDHLAELQRARRPVGVGGIGALGRRVVQRVVAPVEAVGGRNLADAILLQRRVSRERRQVARRRLLLGPVLLDRGDVVARQQVERIHPRPREVAQVTHAVAVPVGERQVGAAVRRGDRLVGDREVAHVQLVDRGVLRLAQGRLAQPRPAVRLQRPRLEVGEDRARGVRGERDRVRVGDRVGHDLVERGHVDLHLVAVRRVAPGRIAGRTPDAVVAAVHGDTRGRVQQDVDALGRRRPDRERRSPTPPHRSQRRAGGIRVERVEHAGDLDARALNQRAGGVEGRDHELAGEQARSLRARSVRDLERREGSQMRELGTHARRQAGGVERQRDRRAAGDRSVLHAEAAAGGVVETERRRAGGRPPGDDAGAQPVRSLHGGERSRGIVADDVRVVVVGERHRAARRGDRDVGSVRGTARAVVLIPRIVQCDLVVVAARRHVEGGPEDARRAGHRLQPRLRAFRLPVAGTPELRLQRTDQRHGARHRRVRLRRDRRGEQRRDPAQHLHKYAHSRSPRPLDDASSRRSLDPCATAALAPGSNSNAWAQRRR
jgi:hypothetical protein